MEKGDFVTIDYISRVKDTNEIFDTTYEEVAKKEGIHRENAAYGPVTIVLGAAHVIPGLEKTLLDMEVGEEKEVDIDPEEAFGKRNPSLIFTVPLREFKKHRILPRPGMRIEINNKWATVRNVSSGRVILDFNHPLSGRTLTYSVHLLEKVEDTKGKIEAVFKLLKLKGKVVPGEDDFSITVEGIQRGKEEKVLTLVKKEIEKYIPEIKISFTN
ncbi:MAG: peptidylprolyl isomerase [Theionarchaea archaeon]|nr:peptidylprolyl isomerase [Theionarchaea archaeon]